MNQKRTLSSKKDIDEAIRQSNETLTQSMRQMSISMLQVAQGFTQSIEVLARAMVNKPSQPQHQYPPYLPADMSAQVRMHGPVHPTGYTQINTSYQEQACRYEDNQTGMDNTSNQQFHSL